MHTLNGVLVNISQHISQESSISEIEETAREIAISETADYGDDVYDWRETDTAGGWQTEYPNNVILGKDNPKLFTETITKLLKKQKDELKYYIDRLKDISPELNLQSIIQTIYNNSDNDYFNNSSVPYSYYGYTLLLMAKTLSGEYNYQSYIFNTETYSAKITEKDLEKIKDHIEDYALVMFDYHS